MRLTIDQKSLDGNYHHVDNHATLTQLGETLRLIYEEKNGAYVTLDISSTRALLRRKDQWITQGEFDIKHKTDMKIINEHGTVILDIETLDFKVDRSQFFMKYHLIQNHQIIDVHEFKCTWDAEV